MPCSLLYLTVKTKSQLMIHTSQLPLTTWSLGWCHGTVTELIRPENDIARCLNTHCEEQSCQSCASGDFNIIKRDEPNRAEAPPGAGLLFRTSWDLFKASKITVWCSDIKSKAFLVSFFWQQLPAVVLLFFYFYNQKKKNPIWNTFTLLEISYWLFSEPMSWVLFVVNCSYNVTTSYIFPAHKATMESVWKPLHSKAVLVSVMQNQRAWVPFQTHYLTQHLYGEKNPLCKTALRTSASKDQNAKQSEDMLYFELDYQLKVHNISVTLSVLDNKFFKMCHPCLTIYIVF